MKFQKQFDGHDTREEHYYPDKTLWMYVGMNLKNIKMYNKTLWKILENMIENYSF